MKLFLSSIATLAIALTLGLSAQGKPVVQDNAVKTDLILRSEVTIDRPVKEVWPHFLDMDRWMTGNRFENISGRRGEEGEVRLAIPVDQNTQYKGYFVTTVRATPFEQYVVKVTPRKGADYVGYADFSFTETGGKTHLIYDIYVETAIKGKSEAQLRQFSEDQYKNGRIDVAATLQRLKTLVESSQGNVAAEAPKDGVVHVPSFDFPLSGFLSTETRAVLQMQADDQKKLAERCPLKKKWNEIANAEDVGVFRQCLHQYLSPDLLARHRARYDVTVEPRKIGGISTEVFTPVAGIAPGNRERVLINLHGGAFMWGGIQSGQAGQVESVPIAALGRIKVVSVDYRMAPEHRFPAASEDVAQVYQALLAQYKPRNIGIYGCSAGGFLTAQAVAWFQKQGLPTPGAIGVFCAGAFVPGGDSATLSVAMSGVKSTTTDDSRRKVSYIQDKDVKDPMAFPGLDPQVLARFPDTLLISSTRDFLMSDAVVTHTELTKLGVKADLYLWEGLEHGFLYEPQLPQSREAYDVIVRFFSEHLGKRPGSSK